MSRKRKYNLALKESPSLRPEWQNDIRVERFEIQDASILICRVTKPLVLALGFLRVSEFKECPEHAGRIFSLTAYRTWFRMQHNGYDYEDFVLGQNLPGESFQRFVETFSDCAGKYAINPVEKRILSWLERRGYISIEGSRCSIRKKFFVLTVNEALASSGRFDDSEAEYSADECTMRHELSHALYYVNRDYRAMADRFWQKIGGNDDEALQLFMEQKHYAPEVQSDECTAYLVEPYDNVLPVDRKRYARDIARLRNCFEANLEDSGLLSR